MCLVAVAAGAMAKAVERMALTLAMDEENTRMRLNPRGMPCLLGCTQLPLATGCTRAVHAARRSEVGPR